MQKRWIYFCKVKTRTYRVPVIGVSFSAMDRKEQLVYLTGSKYAFLADGTKPDIIINPHAIPSRMTIAQLKKITRKSSSSTRCTGDGIFRQQPISKIRN